MVHENQSITITVNVTVFGSQTSIPGTTSLLLHHSEGRSALNQSINSTTEIQHVHIPDKLNCTNSTIQVTVTTNDPLVVFKGKHMISVHIGKKYLSICMQLKLIQLDTSVPTIGFKMIAGSVMEGDTVIVCASVLCGSLLRGTNVTLSTVDDTAKGHNVMILHG